jgi:ABC-type phosphate/phosphonate transport system substrate-binding protein
MYRVILTLLLLLGANTVSALNSHLVNPTKIYTVGILPLDTKVNIFKKWNPLLQKFSKDLGFHLKLATTDTIVDYEDMLKLGYYDFALVSNYQYENYVDKQDYSILSLQKDFKKILNKLENKTDLYFFIVKSDVSLQHKESLIASVHKNQDLNSVKEMMDKITIKNNFIKTQQ